MLEPSPKLIPHYLTAHGVTPVVDVGARAAELEALGWKEWLTTIFPFAFPSEFSWFQAKFWENWWEVCQSIKHNRPIPPKKLNFLLLWGRALAKSSSGTPSTLMKAAFAGRTYSIYLSETIDQSSSHLANIRNLITHPDSRLVEFYPHLELTPLVPTSLGLKSKDTENVFITKGGSIFRALGIESAARGLILAGKRPDDFNIDDIDDVSHGIMVSKKNLRRLTRSVLLTRDIASDLVVTTKILQNIVTETGVVNQIHTGKSDAFAERTTIGVVNTFEKLDLENYIDDNGMMRNRILPTSIPSWEAVSIPKAQAILDLIGLDSFLAECQNKFDQFRAGRVISNYDEDVQLITWSDFERVFGHRRIPAHWGVMAGLDVGFTEGEYPHYSAWDFIATAAMNSPLPNSLFLYRSRTFKGVSIDDQAEAIKADLYSDEMQMVKRWQMSHEASGVMMTLKQRHDLPFTKSKHYGAEDGVAQWQHLSMSDTSKPHPFFPDELDDDGKYLLGRPTLFYIVDDDQRVTARDDNGLKILREQVSTWEYVQVKLTDSGQTVQKPSKVNDDHADVIKGLLGYWGARATDLTKPEQIEAALPEPLREITLAQMDDQRAKDALLSRRRIEVERVSKDINKPVVPAHRLRFGRR